LKTIPRTIAVTEQLNLNTSLISTLESKLMELELEEKELLIKYNEDSRWVRNVREEINIVQKKLDEQKTKNYGTKNFGRNDTFVNLQEEVLRNQSSFKALEAKYDSLTAQLVDIQRELNQLTNSEMHYNQLLQDVETHRQNYRLYTTKFEESRISEAMDTEKMTNVSIIETASPPLKPGNMSPVLMLTAAILLGCFGGLSLALILEFFNDRLEKPEEIEAYLSLPILASVPQSEQ